MTTAVDFAATPHVDSYGCDKRMSLQVNTYMANRYEDIINVHEYLGFSQGIMGEHLKILSLRLFFLLFIIIFVYFH